jgi:hypothetical protein
MQNAQQLHIKGVFTYNISLHYFRILSQNESKTLRIIRHYLPNQVYSDIIEKIDIAPLQCLYFQMSGNSQCPKIQIWTLSNIGHTAGPKKN